jgi:hypothetical protein
VAATAVATESVAAVGAFGFLTIVAALSEVIAMVAGALFGTWAAVALSVIWIRWRTLTGDRTMGLLEVLIVVVFVAWLLGAVVVPIGGSLIHVLLVVVLILVVVRLLQGRDVL